MGVRGCRKIHKEGRLEIDREGGQGPRRAVEPVVNLRRVPETQLGRKTRAAFSSN